MVAMGASTGGRAIGLALLAGLLFGLSTPTAKALVSASDPWMLAGLLYLGSGSGLGSYRILLVLLGAGSSEARLRRSDWPWLICAIVAGGVAGPVLLMFGLANGPASEAALLLNLEAVLTAVVAWFVFREHLNARIAVGMALITAGALLLAWPGAGLGLHSSAVLVGGACLAWAIDNNLTRKVSGGDPVLIAALKGVVAGAANLTIALATGAALPGAPVLLGAWLVGLLGYGLSLVLFVRSLRELGAARTGAYFAVAPFIGAVVAVVVLGERPTVALGAGGALMLAGVWLHLTERHDHEHSHEFIEHDHAHRHDEHHQHVHAPGVSCAETHAHMHVHAPLRHRHPHYPDLHHRHGHRA